VLDVLEGIGRWHLVGFRRRSGDADRFPRRGWEVQIEEARAQHFDRANRQRSGGVGLVRLRLDSIELGAAG
jgi:hypothetical protein